MIRLPYGYGITADSYGYSVGIISTKTVTKNGTEQIQEYIKDPSYPSSLKGCIDYVIKAEQRDLIAEKDMTLSQAIKEIEKLQNHMQEILGETIKEAIGSAEYKDLLLKEINLKDIVKEEVARQLKK